jgi:hypothetical protein
MNIVHGPEIISEYEEQCNAFEREFSYRINGRGTTFLIHPEKRKVSLAFTDTGNIIAEANAVFLLRIEEITCESSQVRWGNTINWVLNEFKYKSSQDHPCYEIRKKLHRVPSYEYSRNDHDTLTLSSLYCKKLCAIIRKIGNFDTILHQRIFTIKENCDLLHVWGLNSVVWY